MIKINLLPVKEKETKQKLLNQIAVGVLILLAALALMGYLYIDKRGQVSAIEAENAKREKEINAPQYRGLEEQKKDLERQIKRLNDQNKIVADLQKGRDWFLRSLEKISDDMPTDVWVDSIQIIQPKGLGKGKESAGGAEKIVLKGRSYTEESIALFMSNLSIIPCDDDLPMYDKSKICQDRHNFCLDISGDFDQQVKQTRRSERTQVIKKMIENAEKCKGYYIKKDEELVKARREVQSCLNGCAARICADKNKAKDKTCLDAAKKDKKCEAECSVQMKELRRLEEENKLLHAEEYIVYDSVSLVSLKRGKASRGALSFPEYSFQVEMLQTSPRE